MFHDLRADDAYTLIKRAEDAASRDSDMPWMFIGPDATLSQKVDGMKRFRKDLALDT